MLSRSTKNVNIKIVIWLPPPCPTDLKYHPHVRPTYIMSKVLNYCYWLGNIRVRRRIIPTPSVATEKGRLFTCDKGRRFTCDTSMQCSPRAAWPRWKLFGARQLALSAASRGHYRDGRGLDVRPARIEPSRHWGEHTPRELISEAAPASAGQLKLSRAPSGSTPWRSRAIPARSPSGDSPSH